MRVSDWFGPLRNTSVMSKVRRSLVYRQYLPFHPSRISKYLALLGRMPSAVSYQPTLATEMGQLQERITSTKKGSVMTIQPIYAPADDYTDPSASKPPCLLRFNHQLGNVS